MKITCQSCQSKYNVADEKVQGKVVKIRCRKCSATIVVDGTSISATNGAASAPDVAIAAGAASTESGPAQADGSPWHVNIAENDQRTMSLAELVDAYQSGLVTRETFLWTDGMDDWKALGEVEAVVAALHAGAQRSAPTSRTNGPARGTPSAPASSPTPSVRVPASQPVVEERRATGHEATTTGAATGARGHSSAFPAPSRVDAAAATATAARADPKRAAAASRDARPRDARGGTASRAPGAAAAASVDDASRRTGERNENSVLFSLAMLSQSVEEQQRKVVEEAPADDSGLIDLRALAVKTESMRPAAAESADMGMMGVYTAPLGAVQPPLAVVPAAMPSFAIDAPLGDMRSKSRLPIVVGVGVVVLLAVVGGLLMAGKMADESTSAAAASATAPAPPAPTPDPEPTATATAAPQASAAPTASASAAAAKPRYRGGPQKAQGGSAPQPQSGGGEAPAAPPKKTGGGGDCGCNGDLMCLMKCSTH